MRRRRLRPEGQALLLLTLIAVFGLTSAHFSVHDDVNPFLDTLLTPKVHAYPQYRIAWSESSLSPLSAQEMLLKSSVCNHNVFLTLGR